MSSGRTVTTLRAEPRLRPFAGREPRPVLLAAPRQAGPLTAWRRRAGPVPARILRPLRAAPVRPVRPLLARCGFPGHRVTSAWLRVDPLITASLITASLITGWAAVPASLITGWAPVPGGGSVAFLGRAVVRRRWMASG